MELVQGKTVGMVQTSLVVSCLFRGLNLITGTNCYDWLSLVAVYEHIISTYILLVHTVLVLTIRSYCISIPCCMGTYRYVIIVIVTVQHMHVYTIIVIATC
jgi:hypothetical protein